MIWITKQKIFNYYLPLFLALVLFAVTAFFWLRVNKQILAFETFIENQDSYQVLALPGLPESGQSDMELVKNKPEVVLSRWDGQVQMAVAYSQVQSSGNKIVQNGQTEMQWKGNEQSVEAYPIKPNAEVKDGGLEFQVTLNKKPQSNLFNFSVNGAEDLNFLYQDSLINEFNAKKGNVSPLAVSCTDTQCLDKDGKVVESRPENVVGSYAVYHSSLRNHEIGSTNYGSGKVFQIYRPKATDASGKEVWAQLSYDNNGTLSVNVPKDFLDSASYPVVVDPTYGYTSLGASEDNTGTCTLYYSGGAFGGTNGSVISGAHWYGRGDTSRSATVYVALYTGVTPTDTLLDSVSQSLAITTTKTQFSISGTGSYSMQNGTTYGIGIISDYGAVFQNEYDTGGSTGAFSCSYSTPPSPIGNGGAWNNQGSWYFDYSVPAAAGTSVKVRGGGGIGKTKLRGGSGTGSVKFR